LQWWRSSLWMNAWSNQQFIHPWLISNKEFVLALAELTISTESLCNPQTMCSPCRRKHLDDPHCYGDIWLFWRDLQNEICVMYNQIVATSCVLFNGLLSFTLPCCRPSCRVCSN
jgi:hypothetical protein